MTSNPSDMIERRDAERYIEDITRVRAPDTDEKLEELNEHVFEIGGDLKVLIQEVKELKEAINKLTDVLMKSK